MHTQTLESLLIQRQFSHQDIVTLLNLEEPDQIERLRLAAEAVTFQYCSNLVYYRGIVEFSNTCALDCHYCGIRRSNTKVGRFTLTKEEIVEAAVEEAADAVAISSYQGGHLEFFEFLVQSLAEAGVPHVRVYGGGGGTITSSEIERRHRAGVARSGAYNRTLTPFGFQAERRTLWEAPEIYFAISPFLHADKVDEPLLMIHGAEDSNSGTYPVQSERMFEAVKGQGGTVRWVELPYEDHGYRGRESVLYVTAEMIE